MVPNILDQDYAVECYGEEQRTEGWNEGWNEASRKYTHTLARLNYPLEQIAAIMEEDLDTVRQWLSEPMEEDASRREEATEYI